MAEFLVAPGPSVPSQLLAAGSWLLLAVFLGGKIISVGCYAPPAKAPTVDLYPLVQERVIAASIVFGSQDRDVMTLLGERQNELIRTLSFLLLPPTLITAVLSHSCRQSPFAFRPGLAACC